MNLVIQLSRDESTFPALLSFGAALAEFLVSKSASTRCGHWAAVAVLIAAALATAFFALRTYGSFRLLRSAQQAGAPMTSSIRGWMTLGYAAVAYRTSAPVLIQHLGLAPDTAPDTSLKSLAEQTGLSPSLFVQRVQRAIAEIAPTATAEHKAETSGWLGTIGDAALTALLVYGYPVLGLTLLFGAIGLPLPDGIATTIAGSLAAQGRMNWVWASAIILAASVLGDVVGYGIGRLLGREVLERHGHWFGYTTDRRARVQLLFARWGSLTVFITRTFVSYLSSVASLLAGMSRYSLAKFTGVAAGGRVIWTAAYFGLGYGVGGDWAAATSFLANLSGFLICSIIVTVAGFFIGKTRRSVV